MPEEALCKLGRQPKILSYIDEKEEKYIQMNCKLKDEITTMQLHYFFNKVYSMKLDKGYAQSFESDYNTSNLIRCFKSILKENNVINLHEIYAIVNKGINEFWNPVEFAIKEFFNMFEVLETNEYSMTEYLAMVRENTINPLFYTSKNNFSKEVEAMEYNSCFISIEESVKNIEENELSKKPAEKKAKIRVKKLNNRPNLQAS